MKLERLSKSLQLYYYIVFLLFFVVVLFSSNLLKNPLFELGTSVAITLQSVGVMYILISIPLGMWFFHQKQQKTLQTLPSEQQQSYYKKIWLLRLVLISFGVILNVLIFYILKDLSMLYAAAIAAVAFIFCKPTMQKIENDFSFLNNQNEKQTEE